jgi:hypothetical protein
VCAITKPCKHSNFENHEQRDKCTVFTLAEK